MLVFNQIVSSRCHADGIRSSCLAWDWYRAFKMTTSPHHLRWGMLYCDDKVEHPDKTQYFRTCNIGTDTIREEKQTLDYLRRVVNAPDVGFDFLGYHISQSGIRLRRSTAQKMIETKTKIPIKKWFKPGSISAEIYGPYWVPPKRTKNRSPQQAESAACTTHITAGLLAKEE